MVKVWFASFGISQNTLVCFQCPERSFHSGNMDFSSQWEPWRELLTSSSNQPLLDHYFRHSDKGDNLGEPSKVRSQILVKLRKRTESRDVSHVLKLRKSKIVGVEYDDLKCGYWDLSSLRIQIVAIFGLQISTLNCLVTSLDFRKVSHPNPVKSVFPRLTSLAIWCLSHIDADLRCVRHS